MCTHRSPHVRSVERCIGHTMVLGRCQWSSTLAKQPQGHIRFRLTLRRTDARPHPTSRLAVPRRRIPATPTRPKSISHPSDCRFRLGGLPSPEVGEAMIVGLSISMNGRIRGTRDIRHRVPHVRRTWATRPLRLHAKYSSWGCRQESSNCDRSSAAIRSCSSSTT